MAFSLAFGVVPGTRGEDRDPIEILIPSEGQPLPVDAGQTPFSGAKTDPIEARPPHGMAGGSA